MEDFGKIISKAPKENPDGVAFVIRREMEGLKMQMMELQKEIKAIKKGVDSLKEK